VEGQAEQKFREGRAALDKGLFREALQLFEESVQLKPSPATLLNLGNCHVQLGELTKALAAFQAAQEEAQRWQGASELRDSWTQEASSHIESLSQSIPELRLIASPTPGVSVQINRNPIATFDLPLRLDPGRYQLEATAPNKQAFAREIVLTQGQKLEVAVPPLQDLPAAVPPLPPPPAQEVARSSGFNVLPWALMGGGGVLVAGSLIPGLMAKSKADDLKRACPSMRDCDPALHDDRDSAATLSLLSDVMWVTGLVTAGVGVTILILDQPEEEEQRTGASERALQLRAGCLGASCGVSAQGTF
jgi:tetratricopeptide (TPR) repeat protein